MNAPGDPGPPLDFAKHHQLARGEGVARLDRVDRGSRPRSYSSTYCASMSTRDGRLQVGVAAAAVVGERAERIEPGRGGSRSRRSRRPSSRSRRRRPRPRRRTASRIRGSASSSEAPRRRGGTSGPSSRPVGVIGPEPRRRALLDLLAERRGSTRPPPRVPRNAREDRTDVVDGAEVGVDRARGLLRRLENGDEVVLRGRAAGEVLAQPVLVVAAAGRLLERRDHRSRGSGARRKRGARATASRRPGTGSWRNTSGTRTPRAAARTTS